MQAGVWDVPWANNVVTGWKMALQTTGGGPYDPQAAMDDSPELPMDSTLGLVERAKAGDREAMDALFERSLPALRRWAKGRLPRWSRDLSDTEDLVQETAIRAIQRIGSFEPRHAGALQAYLRQAVLNRIRDEIRQHARAPTREALDENEQDVTASPLDAAIGRQAVERYETALARLRPHEREAIVARVEMDFSYEDVAHVLGKSSSDAARMIVSRALLRLAEEMSRVA